MSESRALNFASKLPRALVDHALRLADRVTPPSRPIAVAAAALVLSALLVFFYVKTQDYGARRQAETLTRLEAARAIDARWDFALQQARGDAAGPGHPVPASDDLAQIHHALDAAGRELASRPFQASVADLKRAYAEKADLVGRFMRANADARQALAAAMRADAAVSTLVRAAWREFPQRDRLVAAENLVVRVIAEAQNYDRTPTPARRLALQTYAADLAAAHALPRTVQAGLSRLESDVHQLLLLKPLEQTLWERLGSLTTASRLDELTTVLRKNQADDIVSRARYRVYFLFYFLALSVICAYAGMLIVEQYRALDERCAEREAELSEVLRTFEEDAPSRSGEFLPADESGAEHAVEGAFNPYRR